jgi:hypothetical protein
VHEGRLPSLRQLPTVREGTTLGVQACMKASFLRR